MQQQCLIVPISPAAVRSTAFHGSQHFLCYGIVRDLEAMYPGLSNKIIAAMQKGELAGW